MEREMIELLDEIRKRLHSILGTMGVQGGITENVGLTGHIDILHFREGELIDERHIKNVITNTGKAEVAGLINGDTTGPFTYIAIGTGTTAADATDTALESEISSGGGERTSATCSRTTTDTTDDTAQLVATFNFTSSFAVTETGVFDAASDGIMLCRQTFSALNVQSGDSLQITWKIDVD